MARVKRCNCPELVIVLTLMWPSPTIMKELALTYTLHIILLVRGFFKLTARRQYVLNIITSNRSETRHWSWQRSSRTTRAALRDHTG